MVLLQSDSDCRVFKTDNAFIAISENPDLTEAQVRLRVAERALLGVVQKEISESDAAYLIREVVIKDVHIATPSNAHESLISISHVVFSDSTSK